MERQKITKVLELTELQEQINNLREVLNYNNATRIAISNNMGLTKSFLGKLWKN